MRTDTPPIVRLSDYRPSDYLIDAVSLDISLHADDAIVTAELDMRPNPAGSAGAPLRLDGDELELREFTVDGAAPPAGAWESSPQGLTLHAPPQQPFRLRIITRVNPAANTKLMGLYRSSGVYCTQCEAEGFRRITYFLDRPDVLSVYTTRIEADRNEAPLLLGNGNLQESGELSGTGRHYAIWHDPFPKPAYLFALVAGRLDTVSEPFTTMSGRAVEIAVHVEPGKADRAGYALDALARSMRWDEETFGREYDLDVFNVVAVSDFNMGAMENKGLNIFNDKYVLASPETATDADYANIEAIIAHEYFHNWTGNRITCRDWFQLCLKEGLTVFRDHEFSADQRSRPVRRIADVRTLRAAQFVEDAGPLAHPVRPTQYSEINNFYTATVYEKGSELVRMLGILLGQDAFRSGLDLYFSRHDGHAATIEDFLACFAEASGKNLDHFAQWYAQAGTPLVTARGVWDEEAETWTLRLKQMTPPTPGQTQKRAQVIPIQMGLIGASGRELPLQADNNAPLQDDVLVFDQEEMTVTFRNVTERPTPSLFRGFSAPVRCDIDLSDADELLLFRADSDAFNRWQAVQNLMLKHLAADVAALRAGRPRVGAPAFAGALEDFLASEGARDPAFVAQALSVPTEGDIAREIGSDIDPDAIHTARQTLRQAMATALLPALRAIRDAAEPDGAFDPGAQAAGRRALRNLALDLIAAAAPEEGAERAAAQFHDAGNMTDRMAALATLSLLPGARREEALAAWEREFGDDPLVMDKWFGVQAMIPENGTLDRVRQLMSHPGFTLSNPNRARALLSAFSLSNPTQFARADGAGFSLIADVILELDRINPQVASRMLTAFRAWRTLEPGRRGHALAALQRIASRPGLSVDTQDILNRMLAAG
ncbi:aminopeptidase N [Camelimonas fluminis]|uniref:Aminopeptidase N n=1 Tax=Camelimonas fluminis TaxID=1576911 RepID=A0ABV7ULZ9_9HYPH|nr:aminopeptidase N [Camelimonas fluminis]